MALLSSVSSITNKIIPTSKGVIQNSVTGIGADSLMKTLDNVVGSPLQKIFSINLPILGSVGVIDIINYFGHANGLKLSRKGFTAVIAAKVASGVLPSIGGFRLPNQSVVMAQSTTSGVTSASGLSGGLPI